MNLDFAKVCGKHNAIFEAYYKQIDPKGSGAIEAMTAAKFLKKSGLSDVVLSRIWDLSDPNGKGFLDKPGFFVALKLVSLAQAGQVINMSNIYTDTTNPPKVGDLPKILPPRIQTVPVASGGIASGGDWAIKIIDRLKYEQLFESLKPIGGMLPGNKVKGVLMDSKLPMDTLGKIWDLADQDKDGNLDKHEFIVAMHLVFQTLEKRTVPDVLPPELRKAGGGGPPPKPAPPVIAASAAPVASMPRAPSGEGFDEGGFVANFPKDIAPPPAIPSLPAAVPPMQRVPTVPPPLISTDPLIPIGAPPSVAATADWVVTPTELNRYEIMFRDSDRDKDGLVSGLEVKNVFLQSGVPQNCLAHIWALCDTNQSGKLTLEQFALAMWMVERKQKGIEPPQVLTSNMVPPSLRGIIAGVDLQPQADPKPAYSNPELEMISKEIEELAKERRALETEIAQKEADIRIKSGEVRSLQSELDTLSATLKQLEHQRGEAQKRLDDLKVQSTEYQEALANFNLDISQKRNQVNKIREQCQKQEETINEQEGELNSKRSELQKLKDEEAALQKEYEENNKELQNLTKHLQNTQLQISSVRSMVTQLLETQRQMTDALLMCRAAIESNDTEIVSEYQLKIEPDFEDARKTLEKKIEVKPDPFEDNSSILKGTNGFTNGNGFASDPFSSNTASTTTTITRAGFDDSFNTPSVGGFADTGCDAFGSSGGFGQHKDPFGGDAFSANKPNAITPEPGKDDFGSDPFAALHAPTGQGQVLSPNTQKSGPPPRPESPSPALPPKKSKVPPPRPAPPRPLQAPARPAQPAMDAFGAPANSSGFADFADFDNKQPPIIPPPPPTTRTTPSPIQFHTHTPALAINSNSSSFVHASTSASISTSHSTTSTAQNSANINLNRSNTPLQQAVTVNNTTTGKKTTVSAALPVIYGPTDFSDDPFKDYRYEDPFNIKDPFADDNSNNADNVFKDDLSTDDDDEDEKRKENRQSNLNTANTSLNSNSTNATSQTFNSAKSNTPLCSEFLESFDNINMNSSPVPSIQSTASGAAAGSIGGATTTSSVKSQRNTPISSNIGNIFDNFADFDAFSTKSTKSSNNSTVEPLNSESNNQNNNTPSSEVNSAPNDSFFDAFNDNFLDNPPLVGANRKFTSNQNILDAFGAVSTNSKATLDAFGSTTNIGAVASNDFDAFVTKSEKVFDNFNDNAFEDDFFKDKTKSQSSADVNFNITANNGKKDADKKSKTITDNFAAFDAFDDANFSMALNNSVNLSDSSNGGAKGAAFIVDSEKLNKVQNNTTPLSKMQNKTTGAKLPSKFAADYSNSDNFDNDLEEAIKRSMLDK